MFHVEYSDEELSPCVVDLSLQTRDDTSRWKHPQDVVLPERRSPPTTQTTSPHSHRQFQTTLLCRLLPARDIATSRPNFIPAISSALVNDVAFLLLSCVRSVVRELLAALRRRDISHSRVEAAVGPRRIGVGAAEAEILVLGITYRPMAVCVGEVEERDARAGRRVEGDARVNRNFDEVKASDA